MKTAKVYIDNGEYNGRRIQGDYTALGPIKLGTRGWFVTVPGHEVGAGSERSRVIVSENEAKRIKTDMAIEGITESEEKEEVVQEVPEAIALQRMAETFKILGEMVDSMVRGEVTGLVIRLICSWTMSSRAIQSLTDT